MKASKKIILVAALSLVLAACALTAFSAVDKNLMPEDEASGFCLSCHEMRDNVYPEFRKSVHAKNPSGVRADCASCHVPPETMAAVAVKLRSVKDVIAKIEGTIDTPEKFEKNRLRMAKAVWARMEAGNSAECRSCHVEAGFDYARFKKADDAKRMEKGLKEGQTCISCHKGVAHAMPDMSSGYKAVFEELAAHAESGKKKPGKAYALATTPLFLSPDAKKAAGKILPGAEYTVVENHGKMMEIRVDGWQQDGVDALIYGQMGKRIFQTALKKKARGKVERLETVTDPDTDIVWHKVSLTAFAPGNHTIESKEKLWGYGSEMWSASCSSCHSATPPGHFTANLWIGNLKSMKPQLSLTKEEYRFLLAYLQNHASDTGGSSH